MNLKENALIKKYLSELTFGLKDKRKISEITDEMLIHIEDSLIAECGEKDPTDQQIQSVLSRMGEAKETGLQLKQVHQPLHSMVVRVTAFSVMAVFVLGLAYVQYQYLSAKNKLAEAEQLQFSKIDLYIKDVQLLQETNFLVSTKKDHDAGDYLNTKIKFTPFKYFDPLKAELALDEKNYINGTFDSSSIQKNLRSKPWQKHDFSWMKKLRDYDHWDIFSSGPLKQLIQHERPSLYAMPIPVYQDIQGWAKLRLLKGLSNPNDIVAALQETHQLALLTYSNEQLISAMTAVAIFKYELQAYNYAVTNNLIKAESFAPFSETVLDAAKRATWASAAFFQFFSHPVLVSKALLAIKDSGVVCAGLNESFSGNLMIRPFFVRTSFLDRDFSTNQQTMEFALQSVSKNCRLNYVKKLWSENASTISYEQSRKSFYENLTQSDLSILAEIYGRDIPLLKNSIGLWFVSAAMPNWLSLYKQEQNANL